MKQEMPKTWTCECGKEHRFGVYAAAHWDETLIHTCECGREHKVLRGDVTLVRPKGEWVKS